MKRCSKTKKGSLILQLQFFDTCPHFQERYQSSNQEGGIILSEHFLKVGEVAEILGISKSYAYKIVQRLNEELKAKGFITISGRVNKQYFLEKTCYGAAEIKERM